MTFLAKLSHCQRRVLPALAILLAQAALGQGIVFVQMPPTVRSTNGLPPGVTPVTFPEDALGTYVGATLPVVINGQTACTFSSGTSFSVAGSGIIGQQPFPDFPDNVWAVLLAAGTKIGPNAAGFGWFGSSLLASSTAGDTQGEGPLTGGYFAGVEAGYFGFDFQQDGQTYYGWMDVGNPYVTGTGGVGWVYNYAYETTPNTPIAAGTVPEPGALAFFILGAAALIMGRKKSPAF